MPEHVLHWRNGHVRHRRPRTADQGPNGFIHTRPDVALNPCTRVRIKLIAPGCQCVIVVRAGIHHEVTVMMMWKIAVVSIVLECVLQYFHAGNVERVAHVRDGLCDVAQIFCNEREHTELALQNLEQFLTRRVYPRALFGSRVFRVDGPVGLQSAKMVDA